MAFSNPILNNISYFCKGDSSGGPIIFLHGLFDRARTWFSVKKDLESLEAPKYHLISVDMRGHGNSYHTENYEIRDYAQDIKDLMEALNLGPAVLVGHSLGGKVALQLADLYPEKVRALVMEDTSWRSSHFLQLGTIYQKLLELPTPCVSRAELRQNLDSLSKELVVQLQSQLVTDFFMVNFYESSKGWDWKISLEGMRKTIESLSRVHLEREWQALQVPTLVIKGGVSHFLPQEDLEQMKASQPKCQIKVIPQAGHSCHIGHREEFVRHLKTFLENLSDF